MRRAVLLVVASGCAGAPTCPDGTVAAGQRPPGGDATWCERPDAGPALDRAPNVRDEVVDGRALGAPEAEASGHLEGPVTTWHPNGRIRSHGTYEVQRGASLPHGMWTFWWDEGQLMSRGRYINGQRVGCFAMWSRHGGRRTTAFVEGGRLRYDDCEPPRHEEADFAADEIGGIKREPRGDIAASYFLAPVGSFGGDTSTGPEVDIEHAVGLRVQLRSGCRRLAGNVGFRKGDHPGYQAMPLTLGYGQQWNYPSTAWSVEGSVEAGAHLVWAQPTEGGASSVGQVFHWTPMIALSLELGVSKGRYFDLVVGGRFEGRLPREYETETLFCNPCRNHLVDWQLGGVSIGPTIALRSRIW